MEIFLTLSIPVFSSFSFLWLFSQFEHFKKQKLIALVYSIFAGLFSIVFILTILGIVLNQGFTVASRILYSLTGVFSIMSLAVFFKTKASVHINLRNSNLIFLSVLVSILLIHFIIRPVVDSDVIESYLPLARSIVKADHIPTHNYYDNKPFIIPPVGSSVYFAYFYSIAGDIYTEVFRFINIPFFLGSIILSYKILRQYFSTRSSLLGVIIFVSFPLIEDLIFQVGLYPDFIFLFLASLILYLLDRIHRESSERIVLNYLVLGGALALSLLFKYQAILLYAIVFSTLALRLFGRVSWVISLLIVLVPTSTLLVQGGPKAFLGFGNIVGIFLAVILAFTNFLLHNTSKIGKYKINHIVAMTAMSMLGWIYILFVFSKFGGLSDQSVPYRWAVMQEIKIGGSPESSQFINIFALFILPIFSVYWLIPKLLSILKIKENVKLILPLYVLVSWYTYWIIILGGVDTKWLLPILPYISIFIIYGLKKAFSDKYLESAVWIGSGLKIFFSKYIFWNLAEILLNPKTSSSLSANHLSGISTHSLIENIFSIIRHYIMDLIYIYTARENLRNYQIVMLLISSILIFLSIGVLCKYFYKLKLNIVIPVSIVCIYFLVIGLVCKGNIFNYAEIERKQLFDYWGIVSHVVPYIKSDSAKEDKIVMFGIPSGLTYYTGQKVYNLQYGGGLSVLYDIFPEKNLDKVNEFLQLNHFKYFLFLDDGESQRRFNNLKKETDIFKILDDPKFSTKVISKNDNNLWILYKIN